MMDNERTSIEQLGVKAPSAQWQARSAVCELLSLSFRYPENGLLAQAISSGEWADAADEIAACLGLTLSDEFHTARSHVAENAEGETMDSESLVHVLRAEATRLFIGPRRPVVSPYEGIWRSDEEGVEGLLFVNPHTRDVVRFCAACGLGCPEGVNEPLDHVATELELLEYLAAQEAGLFETTAQGPAPEELPGGSSAAAYTQFLTEHVALWIPRFAQRTAEESNIPFYRVAAELLFAFIEGEN